MNATTFKEWYQQITTGIGVLLGTPVVIALLLHQITWQQAITPLVGAVIGLVWPENKVLAQQAQTVAADAETLIPSLLTAYRTGLQHGAAAVVPAPVPEKTAA